MTSRSEIAPVVIAGSGPAGSVLALYLAQRDIPVVLLEKEAALPVDLRASTFHPPSLEMIASLGHGVIDSMLSKGLKVDHYQYRDRRTNEQQQKKATEQNEYDLRFHYLSPCSSLCADSISARISS